MSATSSEVATASEPAPEPEPGGDASVPAATGRTVTTETETRLTRRWRGVVAVALFGAALGLVAKRPTLLLLAPVGVAFAAYPRLTRPPSPSVALERRLSTRSPAPEESVEVTVTVRNEGEHALPDVRIVDGVPPALAVESGTPRHTAPLRAGDETTFSYQVSATQGLHSFEPATGMVRDLSGGTEVELAIATETEIECLSPGRAEPPIRQTQRQVGPIETEDGGSGIEFYGTREYRRGDRLNRIDWRRFARTGALTTVEYREERVASVVLCVDAREPAYRSATPDDPHAVAYGVGAADQLFQSLQDTPNRVGLATVGRDLSWLSPGRSRDRQSRAHRLLADVPSRRPSAESTDSDAFRELRTRLPPNAQVVLLSPLADGRATEAAYTLEASGHAVVVVSPDVTSEGTAGARLAALERDQRVAGLRDAGIPVRDWAPDEPLGTGALDPRERWFQ